MKFTGSVPSTTVRLPELTPNGNPLVHTNGHWDFPEPMGGKEFSGFVYVVYDRILNRGYLGKKTYWGAGKLNAGKESNWKSYSTSSDILKALLKVRPKDEFEFICLEQYRMKGALSYAETWSACLCEVPTTSAWYNTRIEAVSWSVREPISKRHKDRLERIRLKVLRV